MACKGDEMTFDYFCENDRIYVSDKNSSCPVCSGVIVKHNWFVKEFTIIGIKVRGVLGIQ